LVAGGTVGIEIVQLLIILCVVMEQCVSVAGGTASIEIRKLAIIKWWGGDGTGYECSR
jgi:hypothetical protein